MYGILFVGTIYLLVVGLNKKYTFTHHIDHIIFWTACKQQLQLQLKHLGKDYQFYPDYVPNIRSLCTPMCQTITALQ